MSTKRDDHDGEFYLSGLSYSCVGGAGGARVRLVGDTFTSKASLERSGIFAMQKDVPPGLYPLDVGTEGSPEISVQMRLTADSAIRI